MENYFGEDYDRQDLFEFYAREEWNLEHTSSEYDQEAFEDWADEHFEEIVDVMDEAIAESDGFIQELLEEDPDWYESADSFWD